MMVVTSPGGLERRSGAVLKRAQNLPVCCSYTDVSSHPLVRPTPPRDCLWCDMEWV